MTRFNLYCVLSTCTINFQTFILYSFIFMADLIKFSQHKNTYNSVNLTDYELKFGLLVAEMLHLKRQKVFYDSHVSPPTHTPPTPHQLKPSYWAKVLL